MIYFGLIYLFAFVFKKLHCCLSNPNISQNLAYSPSKVHPLKEIHTGSHESTFPFFPIVCKGRNNDLLCFEWAISVFSSSPLPSH